MGFALGKSLGSREILGVGDGFSNTSLLLVEHGYNKETSYLEKTNTTEIVQIFILFISLVQSVFSHTPCSTFAQ